VATLEAPVVNSSYLPFRLEDHTVVLVDDVLYTGRTARAAIEVLARPWPPRAGAARRDG
jgi:pyrimidine operon attenuation protein / uracil phosphoribosyltransferase